MPLALFQIRSGVLAGTRINVYSLSKKLYQHDWTDEDFDQMEQHGELFLCEDCGEWKDLSEKDPHVRGFCTSCADEIDTD
jgi:hypothetical protein